MASNEELSTIFNSNYFVLISKDAYNNKITNIIRNPELSYNYGLKYGSIFNSFCKMQIHLQNNDQYNITSI